MGKRRVRNRHAQLPHGGEVRQAAMARGMALREEHFLGWTLYSAPLPDATLQRAQHAIGETIGVVVLELAQQRNGHQRGRAPEQRNNLRVPHVGEWVGPRAPIAPGLLGGYPPRTEQSWLHGAGGKPSRQPTNSPFDSKGRSTNVSAPLSSTSACAPHWKAVHGRPLQRGDIAAAFRAPHQVVEADCAVPLLAHAMHGTDQLHGASRTGSAGLVDRYAGPRHPSA